MENTNGIPKDVINDGYVFTEWLQAYPTLLADTTRTMLREMKGYVTDPDPSSDKISTISIEIREGMTDDGPAKWFETILSSYLDMQDGLHNPIDIDMFKDWNTVKLMLSSHINSALLRSLGNDYPQLGRVKFSADSCDNVRSAMMTLYFYPC